MKLIDKHLLREYVVPLLYCLCGLSMIYVIVGLFEKAADFLRAGMPMRDFLSFYLHYVLAYADKENVSCLVRLLPVSVMAGTLYSLAAMTRNNELTAMRASGVSLFRLMYPFLGVGLACSALSVLVQERVAPHSSWIVDNLDQKWRKGGKRARLLVDYKYRNEEARRTWRIGRLDLEKPNLLQKVRVTVDRPGSTRRLAVIEADKAEWRDGKWWFYGRVVQKYGPDDQPIDGVIGPESHPVAMHELTETPTDFVIQADIDNLERYSTSLAVLRYLKKRATTLQADRLASKRVDAHRRLAMPWVCLVVALFSIPAGAKRRRQGAFASALLAVAFFIVYYCAIYVAAVLGKNQMIRPWLSAWLPNIGFFIAGTIMVSRMR